MYMHGGATYPDAIGERYSFVQSRLGMGTHIANIAGRRMARAGVARAGVAWGVAEWRGWQSGVSGRDAP